MSDEEGGREEEENGVGLSSEGRELSNEMGVELGSLEERCDVQGGEVQVDEGR